MLQNACLDAKIGVDPAENEPRKEGLCRGGGRMLESRPTPSAGTALALPRRASATLFVDFEGTCSIHLQKSSKERLYHYFSREL